MYDCECGWAHFQNMQEFWKAMAELMKKDPMVQLPAHILDVEEK